ncbi:hypothetical protein AAHA92_32463 [Salvia divinorum]|uniref:Uncharacterized protein n=1 Tax=Salvia divinorum TaxID=28513 RepID=A0ABD1FKT7_SALDI
MSILSASRDYVFSPHACCRCRRVASAAAPLIPHASSQRQIYLGPSYRSSGGLAAGPKTSLPQPSSARSPSWRPLEKLSVSSDYVFSRQHWILGGVGTANNP